jgi:opacity protein-like surface antigen
MLKHISKLMILVIMSFFISSTLLTKAFAEEEVTKSAPPASSDREIHKHAIGIGLGQTFLLGQFEKYGDNRISGDFLYSYTASYSFDLLINIHFSDHETKEKEVKLAGYVMSIKARSYEFDAFSPFLLGGLGFYSPQIIDGDEESEVKSTFGFNLGAGVDLRLNQKVIIGLMTQYHKPFEVKQDETSNIVGSYFKLLLTAMYQF